MPRALAACCLLLLIVLAVFRPVLRNEFVNFDDQNEILGNPSYNPVTVSGLLWNFSHTRLTLYMPVTYLVWGAVATVAPRTPDGLLKPAAFHGLSLGLHGIATVLVFFLIRRCLQLRPTKGESAEPVVAPFVGALLFAVHPIQTEAVAWASGMYTILSTIWSVAALLCYIRHAVRLRDDPKSFHRGWFFLATGFFGLAVLTKAAAVVVPGLAAVIDLLLVGRPVRRVAMSLGFWMVLTIPVVYAAKSFQDLTSVPAPPGWARPIVAIDSVSFYLRKIVWPDGFIPDYGRNPRWVMKQMAGLGPLNPRVDPAWIARHQQAIFTSIFFGVMFATVVFALLCARRAPRATAGGLLFLGGIFPYMGLTTFDFQYVSTVADRYAYTGMIGVGLAVAAMISRRRWTLPAALVCIPLAVLSYRQAKLWQTTWTLFDYTLEENPKSLVAKNIYGFLWARQGRPDIAEDYYTKALLTWPEDAVIHFNLGNLYAGGFRNDLRLAVKEYGLAVQYQPHFAVYRNSLAAVYARQENFPEAISQWKRALSDDPQYIDAHNNLGSAYITVGRADLATAEYEAVLEIDPNNETARYGLAKAQRPAGGSR